MKIRGLDIKLVGDGTVKIRGKDSSTSDEFILESTTSTGVLLYLMLLELNDIKKVLLRE